MNDFNNIETDPIPEGLEFNESYMQSAFAMYDAEKNKRKRRLLIWWITSALGFTSLLVIGISVFDNGETSANSGKIRSSNANTEKIVQRPDSGDSTDLTVKAYQSDKNKQVTRPTPYSMPGNSNIQVETTFAVKSLKNRRAPKTKSSVRLALRNHQKTQPKATEAIPGELSPRSTAEPVMPEELTTSTQTDSGLSFDSVNLPVRSALLAYTPDSALPLPAYDQTQLLPAEESDLRKHHVYLNLGVNTLFGIQELKKRTTFRESIGLSYTYQIHPKIAISAGFEYHSISRISYKRMIGDTTNSDKTTTILNKTTLNYISFLPQIQYQLWPHHRITAGFGMEYLLTDPGEQYEIKNYTQESQKRTNSKLYYSTFNRFNFSVSLGYVYEFSRFMSVQASYHYGFTDITINNAFNKTFDRNSRLQVGLKIKLY